MLTGDSLSLLSLCTPQTPHSLGTDVYTRTSSERKLHGRAITGGRMVPSMRSLLLV
jgi:hypothetical protein